MRRRPARPTDAPNRAIARLVTTHLAAVMAEWAAVIATLVYVFDREGATATGFASIGLIVAALLATPITASATDRWRPQRVRQVGLVGQLGGYAVAALSAANDPALPVAVGASMVALGAVTTLRPTGAVLLPAYVRDSDELVRANLWIWYVESVSVLAGPLLATVLLAAGGPSAVLVGCAAAAAVGLGLSVSDAAIDPPSTPPVPGSAGGALRVALRGLDGRPGLRSVLAVVLAQYVMIGALDLTLVVAARTDLDLGDAGPGVLTTAFGVGACASIVLAAPITRRRRLAPVLLLALIVAGAGLIAFGAALTLAVGFMALPALGVARSLFDGPSRLLLQRSAPPEALGSMFAIRELCAGAGLIIGSAVSIVLLEIGDPSLVLVVLGCCFVGLAAASWGGLRVSDAAADVPVVEMSLLRRLPMFASLPPVALEAVARSATPVAVSAGDVLIKQGDAGDVFYAVVDGSFEVEMSGTRIRSAERFSFFGEVALLADVPRTATVTATTDGNLLAIDRTAFLIAVTGTDSSRQAAWGVVRQLELGRDVAPNSALGVVPGADFGAE